MMTRNNALLRASQFYLCEGLPLNFHEFTDVQLYDFIETYAWEPFKGYDPEDLFTLITALAEEFVSISRSIKA